MRWTLWRRAEISRFMVRVKGEMRPTPASCWSAREIARLGVLLALATSLHIFEAQLPSPAHPGAKIGLANLVSLFALYAWGVREALLIAVMDSWSDRW